MAEDDKEARRKKSLLKSSQGASLKELPNVDQLQRDSAAATNLSPGERSPKRGSSPSMPDHTDNPASPVFHYRDDTRSPSPSVTHHHTHKDKSEKKDKEHHHHHRGKSPGVDGAMNEMSRSATTLPNVPLTLQATKSTGVLPDITRPKTPPAEVKPQISRPPPTDDDDHVHHPVPASAEPLSPTASSAPKNPLKQSMDSRLASLANQKEIGPEDFRKVKLLGKGDVGKVYLVQRKDTGQYFAMKVLSKQEMIQRNKVKRVMTEREILATTNHPFIVTLYHSFMSMDNLYFVMEYCAGGEFFRTLQKQPGRCLPEEATKFYTAEVLLALEYLHSKGFIYRDLKPENILLHETGHIMLTDFDLSKSAASTVQPGMVKNMVVSGGKGKTPQLVNKPDIVTNSFVGTEEYIAPEVIEGFGHSSAVDWWTFGILLYEMLFGVTPFRGRNRDDTFNQIIHAGIKFPDKPEVSKDAKSILKSLLTPDPKKRLGAVHGAPDVKAHKWFKNINFALIRNAPPPIKPKVSGPLDTSNFRKIEDPSLLDEDHALSSAQIEEITHDISNPFHDFKPLTKPHHGASTPPVPHGTPNPNPMSMSMGASPRKSAPGSGPSLKASMSGHESSPTPVLAPAPSFTRSASAQPEASAPQAPPAMLRASSVATVETPPAAAKSDTDDGRRAITSGSDSAAEGTRKEKKEKKEHHHHHHHHSDSDSSDEERRKEKKEKKLQRHQQLGRSLLSGSEAVTSDTDGGGGGGGEHDKKERKVKKEKKDKKDTPAQVRRDVTSGSEAVESEGDAGRRDRKESRARKPSLAPERVPSSGIDKAEPVRDATESPAPVHAFRKIPSMSVEEGAMLDVKKEKEDDGHQSGRHKKHHDGDDKKEKKSKKKDESSSTE